MKKIVIILTVMLISTVIYFLLAYKFEAFYQKGYRGKQLEYVKKLDQDTKELLKNYPRIKEIERLLSDKTVDKTRLKDYLDLLNQHQDIYEDVLNAVNLRMSLNEYYDYKNNIFKDDKYYLDFNKKRYEENYPKFKNQAQPIRKTIEFVNTKADLKPYEDVFEADLSKGNLVLVNKYYYLPDDYIPDDLVEFKQGMGRGYIRKEAFDAFEKMHLEALKSGYQLISVSPFRAFSSQYFLYNSYAASDGKQNADRYSARAGFSEHQTGLVIDISIPGYSIEAFGNTEAYKWMSKYAADYGFIERYPLNKEDVTGYIYEPWHYRYVGVEVAKKIKQQQITFDEYYEYYVVGGKKDV